ncbi:MAG: site-specific DNA-methyltransferase [Roseovarius sp.]|nr:site-specific DNA-methyltransferase [Roseovarius sp.]
MSADVRKDAIIRRLSEIDWDFTTEKSESDFSGLHWHPCRFPSQVPAVAISRLSRPGDTVLDPFMGSATTLVEAKRLGRNSVGIDINPVSCLMASAKLVEEPGDELAVLIDRFKLRLSQGWEHARLSDVPEAVQGTKWFADQTLTELRKIWGMIEQEPEPIYTIVKATFSSILLPSCRETRHWGYVCDNSQPKTDRVGEAKKLFLIALERFKRAHLARTDNRGSSAHSKVICQDSRLALKSLKDGEIDCFVTSPPYLGVADYVKAQRLSMEWFGFEIEPLRKEEIGARSKRYRKDNHAKFIADIGEVFDQTARVLKSGGYGVIVFGSSPSRKDTVEPFIERVLNSGFSLDVRKSRNISSNRRQMPSLMDETVFILRKE